MSAQKVGRSARLRQVRGSNLPTACQVCNRARQFQDAVIGTPDMQGIGIAFAIDGVSFVLRWSAVSEDAPDRLGFCDPYQIVWQISVSGDEFRTAGDFANRWLKL